MPKYPTGNTVQVRTRVPRDLWKKLKIETVDRNTTVAEIVETLIREHFSATRRR